MERYRSGHNEAVLKTVCPQGRVGRIPPSPFQEFRRCGTPFCITGDGKMTQKIKHYICEKDGRIKWQFRLILSAAILSIMLAESRFLYYHSPKDTKWLICIIYALTGYYCPGCGAGRACYCILHGQIYQAFRYNPLLVLLLPWIGAYLALCACQWLFTGRESISRRIPMWILWIILAVILIYGVLRNVNAYPFVLLSPTRVR